MRSTAISSSWDQGIVSGSRTDGVPSHHPNVGLVEIAPLLKMQRGFPDLLHEKGGETYMLKGKGRGPRRNSDQLGGRAFSTRTAVEMSTAAVSARLKARVIGFLNCGKALMSRCKP